MHSSPWSKSMILSGLCLALFPIIFLGQNYLPADSQPEPPRQTDACTPQSLYPSSDRIEGFNGLALEYSIQGLPVSENEDNKKISGYPDSDQVVFNFKFEGPYSIVNNHATWADVYRDKDTVLDEARAPDQDGAPGWSYTSQTIVIPITDEVRRSGFHIWATVGYARSGNSEDVTVDFYGLPCAAPVETEAVVFPPELFEPPDQGPVQEEPESPADEPGALPWVIAVFGTGALAAAAAAVIAISTARKGRKPEQDETAGFVLELSQTEIYLSKSAPVSLRAVPYRVLGSGQTVPAPDAVVTIQPPRADSGVTVSPPKGQGACSFTVTQTGQLLENISNFYISAADGKSHSQPQLIQVHALTNFTARVNNKTQFDVVYNPVEKCWAIPEIICCFRDGEDRPVKTEFEWGVPETPAEFVPDNILKYEECYVHDPATMAFTLKAALKPDVDFYKDKAMANWLENDGKVTVTVTVKDDHERTYKAEVILNFRVQLHLEAFSYDTPLDKTGYHTYMGNRLEGLRFVADGMDVMRLGLCYTRTDIETEKGQEFRSAVTVVEIDPPEWLNASFLAEPVRDFESGSDRVPTYLLHSNEFIQPSPEVANHSYILKVTPHLKPEAPANFTFEENVSQVPVSPQFIQARLWVAPGLKRDTSEALAYVQLVPSCQGFGGLPLQLSTLSQGSGFLQLDGCSETQSTCDKDNRVMQAGSQTQLTRGMAMWTLRYSGMTWDNFRTARFNISCEGPQTSTGPMFTLNDSIDVGKNVDSLLKDFFEDKTLQKELNNDTWQKPVLSAVPYFVRGQIWNIYNFFDEKASYVCAKMRRIIEIWLFDRRKFVETNSDPEAAFARFHSMNGIEFENYIIIGIHVWAGIFLSGSSQQDYKALDPWWEQRWDDPALMRAENLLTKNDEFMNLAKEIAMVGVIASTLLGMFAAIGVHYGAIALSSFCNFLLMGGGITSAAEASGLTDFYGSHYYAYDPVAKNGAYALNTSWFAKMIEQLKAKDRQKFNIK